MTIFQNQQNFVQILETKLTSPQTYDDFSHAKNSFGFNF
jgi:hypothetical protein